MVYLSILLYISSWLVVGTCAHLRTINMLGPHTTVHNQTISLSRRQYATYKLTIENKDELLYSITYITSTSVFSFIFVDPHLDVSMSYQNLILSPPIPELI